MSKPLSKPPAPQGTVAATFTNLAASIRPDVAPEDLNLFEARVSAAQVLANLLGDGLADHAKAAALHRRFDEATSALWSMRAVVDDDDSGDFAQAVKGRK
jgi:hypothetical protein